MRIDRILIARVCLFVLIAAAAGPLRAEPFRAPWDAPAAKKVSSRSAEERKSRFFLTQPQRIPAAIGRGMLRAYQVVFSPRDGRECPMYPTCTTYAKEAVKKHGMLLGFAMTCDRLTHEPDEPKRVPSVIVRGHLRWFDPVENNDFWITGTQHLAKRRADEVTRRLEGPR
jgi:hypothetical protein